MKYQESSFGQRADFAEYVKKVVPDLFAGRLTVEGNAVTLPQDVELDYKVKYDTEETGGSFSIKVSWEYPVKEDEEVEVDVD